MLHLHPDDARRIAALADDFRHTSPARPSSRNSARLALGIAIMSLPDPARAELVALMWLGGDVNGDGRDPVGWPALVAHARAVSRGPGADAAYVAGKHAVLGDRLRAGLAALDAVWFN